MLIQQGFRELRTVAAECPSPTHQCVCAAPLVNRWSLFLLPLPSHFFLLEPGNGQVKTVQLPCWRNYRETGALEIGRALGDSRVNVPTGSAERPVM